MVLDNAGDLKEEEEKFEEANKITVE